MSVLNWKGLFSKIQQDADERAKAMPTAEDAIRAMYLAGQRLRDLGWSDAIYCPKDGSEFMATSPASSAPYVCQYWGEWPDGTWMQFDPDGDCSSVFPSFYQRTEAEKEKLRAAIDAYHSEEQSQCQ